MAITQFESILTAIISALWSKHKEYPSALHPSITGATIRGSHLPSVCSRCTSTLWTVFIASTLPYPLLPPYICAAMISHISYEKELSFFLAAFSSSFAFTVEAILTIYPMVSQPTSFFRKLSRRFKGSSIRPLHNWLLTHLLYAHIISLFLPILQCPGFFSLFPIIKMLYA